MGIETGFFEIEGIHLTGGSSLYSGTESPIDALIDLPIGSLYLRSDSTLWRKYGALTNQWIQISGPDAVGAVQRVVTTATQYSNSQTYADITGLSITLAANAIYNVDSYVVWQSAALENGMGLQFISPNGAVGYFYLAVPIATNTTAASNILSNYFPMIGFTNSGNVLGTSCNPANSNHTSICRGHLVMGATAGAFKLMFRSETTLNGVTIQPGSQIIVTRVV